MENKRKCSFTATRGWSRLQEEFHRDIRYTPNYYEKTRIWRRVCTRTSRVPTVLCYLGRPKMSTKKSASVSRKNMFARNWSLSIQLLNSAVKRSAADRDRHKFYLVTKITNWNTRKSLTTTRKRLTDLSIKILAVFWSLGVVSAWRGGPATCEEYDRRNRQGHWNWHPGLYPRAQDEERGQLRIAWCHNPRIFKIFCLE